ncbi:hypothetical protein [Actinotalea sp. C106]|uniref:hypothetical protein n=1 Tax=Actinotalea sp. C106 TaxID=2908644 RepID=UPI0020279BAA|nr:hypothetical protein [Actinotalea sp. C106]
MAPPTPARRLHRPLTLLAALLLAVAAVNLPVAGLPATALPGTGLPASPPPGTVASTVPAVTTTDEARPRLTWRPPALTSPEVVRISATNRALRLDDSRDYVLQMPSTPLEVEGGLTVSGGRNVVLVGGTISIPAGAEQTNHAHRGLFLKNQTGTVHVEGLLITGVGLGEGINLDQREGAVVQLQNVRVETTQGSLETNHADVLQTWAGPRVLRVDRLSAATEYQGFFLLPQQFGTQAQPEVVDLRRVDLRGTPESGYLLWRDDLEWPLTVQDVWVAPRNPSSRDSFLWPKGSGPGTEAWPQVDVGTPPGGEFVPAGLAGTGYTSPGYTSAGTGLPGGGGGTLPSEDETPEPPPTPRLHVTAQVTGPTTIPAGEASSVAVTYTEHGQPVPSATLTLQRHRNGTWTDAATLPITNGHGTRPLRPGTTTTTYRWRNYNHSSITAPFTITVQPPTPRLHVTAQVTGPTTIPAGGASSVAVTYTEHGQPVPSATLTLQRHRNGTWTDAATLPITNGHGTRPLRPGTTTTTYRWRNYNHSSITAPFTITVR